MEYLEKWLRSLGKKGKKYSSENLKNLKRLYISNNITKLPKEIGNLTKLKILNLNFNELKSLPSEIGNLKKLEELEVENNHLTSIPSSIGKLKNLKILRMSENEIKSLPSSIGNLTQLNMLTISNNPLLKLPSSIGNLINLIDLGMAGVSLKKLPSSIGDLIKLKRLYISNTKIKTLPPQIGKIPNLTIYSEYWDTDYNSLYIKLREKQQHKEKVNKEKGKVEVKHIILKQGILNSKKYGQLFLLFEKMCAEVKNETDIHKLRGMAEALEIKGVDKKSKEELCSEIGAEILIKLNLAKRFEF